MVVADSPLSGLGYVAPSASRDFVHLSDTGHTASAAIVAEEVPIAFVYNGRPYTVVMGSPLDLEDLATGFSITEGIVPHADAIERLEVVRASHGIELQIELSATDQARLADRSRTLVARTGCGLCGIETIKDAMRVPVGVPRAVTVAPDALWAAGEGLSHAQTLNGETRSVHGAAWANRAGQLAIVREDVGRHNALDKVLGAMARTGVSAADGFVVVTSRASYEMVQKAAVCGIELLAAISRPTGLAIRFADAAGVTLVGLLRGRSGNVYANADRIVKV